MTYPVRGGIAAFLACVSGTALAQTSPAGSSSPSSAVPAAEDAGNEVIVTAQKREEKVEDVPATITAVTGTRMADIGVNSLSEVALFVPGLRIQEQSANNPGVVIRGITSDGGSAQQGARVTLY